ncbi:MAG: cytochrome c oxidase subunit II [Bacteroidota bacterium]|nr:cytochrome c oxidase subunit II [Bacteroidota bacterium]
MFSNASNFVHGVDKVFLIIGGISLFFLLSFTALMIYFIIKYNRKRNNKAVQVKDNTLLEVTWTTIPVILVLMMFYIGWQGFLPMRQDPKNAMHVKAIGKMWKWTFEYSGNKQSDTLFLPINKSVRVDLVSLDVIHGFFVPAFRIKEDVVPGKKNYCWFIPGQVGDFDLFCSAYCGVSHSYMQAIIRIVPQEKFDKWLAALPVKKEDTNLGHKLLEKNGCIACHSVDGSKLAGPTFKGLYGSAVDVTTDGVNHKIKADSTYIRTSILEPNKDIVNGYPQNVMKSYKGIIADKDIQLVVDYLKTLK